MASAFSPEARVSVFRLYEAGVATPRIVKSVTRDFHCSPRPVRQLLAALELLHAEEQGLAEDLLTQLPNSFVTYGGTYRALSEIRRAYAAFRGNAGGNRVARHWSEISQSVQSLRLIGSLALHDHDLGIWATRPSDLEWPIGGGFATRGAANAVSVHFTAEDSLDLGYIRKHLPEDPVWGSMERCRNAISRDLSARLELFDQVREMIERPEIWGGLGVPLLPRIDSGRPGPGVGAAYVFGIVDRIMSARLRKRGPRPRLEWSSGELGVGYVGSHVAAASKNDAILQDRMAAWYAKAPWKLRRLGHDIDAAARDYTQALHAVDGLRAQADRILASSQPPTGTRCDLCISWLADDLPPNSSEE